MNDTDRYRLLHGPYQAPDLKPGDWVHCVRIGGEAVVTDFSDGPIKWPLGRFPGRPGNPSLLLFGPLIHAVKHESAQAVARWWGVSLVTVHQWRKILGVPFSTEGTRRLRQLYAHEPAAVAGRLKAVAGFKDAEHDRPRREKIAAAHRGKKRPRHVVEAVIRSNRSRIVTEQTRRRMSEAHRKRGSWPPAAGRPWTAEEDELVRTLTCKEAALRTGRPYKSVSARRRGLGLPDGRWRSSAPLLTSHRPSPPGKLDLAGESSRGDRPGAEEHDESRRRDERG